MGVPIATYIEYAKISQYLAANDKSKSLLFRGRYTPTDLDRKIYIVRRAVEDEYNRTTFDTGVFQSLNNKPGNTYLLINGTDSFLINETDKFIL